MEQVVAEFVEVEQVVTDSVEVEQVVAESVEVEQVVTESVEVEQVVMESVEVEQVVTESVEVLSPEELTEIKLVQNISQKLHELEGLVYIIFKYAFFQLPNYISCGGSAPYN